MNREELIDRFRNESAKADIRANYHRSEFAEGQASAYEAAAELVEESIPANSITLTLPVYADGDPRAGEGIANRNRAINSGLPRKETHP